MSVTGSELLTLLVLALPVASIAWTVTHEELFRELREYCVTHSERKTRPLATRKFFYVFTCEYCFSHYVAAAAVFTTRFRLLFDDWRGSLIGWLALVWVANHLMSLFGRLRLGIRSERLEIGLKEAVSEQAGVSKLEQGPAKSRKAS
jgi:hypothetical protein